MVQPRFLDTLTFYLTMKQRNFILLYIILLDKKASSLHFYKSFINMYLEETAFMFIYFKK